MLRLIYLAVLVGLLVQSTAHSQAPPPNAPTTVQLPTFSFFTVQTTVSVPDSGGAYLGGLGRGADGSTQRGFGPLGNRAQGSSRGASGVSAHATIHDKQEMDEAVLAQAAGKANFASPTGVAKAELISSRVGRVETASASSAAAGSLAEIRGRQAAEVASRVGEAKDLFSKAQRAEAEGKPGLAKIYYQMVLRRDAGPLRQSAQSRLAALDDGKTGTIAAR